MVRKLIIILGLVLSVSRAAAAITATQSASAEQQTMATGEWSIQLPSKAYKDLPNLTAESEFVEGNTLGRISFVCDRAKYYLLPISPFFERKPIEQSHVAVGSADRHAVTFRDLYGTRNALGAKLNWDADILFAEIPVALLDGLADGGTLRVDLRDWSWSIAFKGVAAQTRSFAAFLRNRPTSRQMPFPGLMGGGAARTAEAVRAGGVISRAAGGDSIWIRINLH